LNLDEAPTAANASATETSPGVRAVREASLASFVLVVALIGFGFLLEPGMVPYSKHSDLIAEHLPLKYAAYQALEAREGLPHWRRDMLSGGPALTNPQAVYLHPLQWPFLVMHPLAASGLSYWLHFLCMGLSMLVLGAVLGLSPFARAFIAVAGMFCFKGIAIAYAGWLPVMPGFVCAPLLIAGVLRALDRPDIGATLLLASAGCLVLLSGHLQIPYYLVLFLGVYFCWALGRQARSGGPAQARRSGAVGFAAAAIGLASAAYVFLPFLEEIGLIARTTSDFAFLQSEGAFAPRKLLTFLHPEWFGSPLDDSYEDISLWEDVAYFGVIPQLLALLGGYAAWRRRHGAFLVAGVVFSIAFSFDSFLLSALYEWVPGFSLFRHPARFLFLTTLFGIALSGFGVDALIERFEQTKAAAAPSRLPALVAGVLFAVTLYEGATTARRYLTTLPADRVVPPATGFGDFFAAEAGPYRVAPLQRGAINYAWAAFYDLELVTGFEPHNYRHYQQYMNLLATGQVVEPTATVWMDLPQIRRWDLLEAMGVRFLVSAEALPSPPPSLALRETLPEQPVFVFYDGLGTATLYVYEVVGARPRGFFANEIVAVGDGEAAFRALSQRNLRRKTVVEMEPARAARIPAPGNGDLLRVTGYGAASVNFEADSRQGGLAVVSEVWHPGWRAHLDGEPVEVLRANGAFLAVEVPPGNHTLSLVFEPPGLSPGWGLTSGAALVLLLLGGWRVLKPRSAARK